jgi:hypothetical protein
VNYFWAHFSGRLVLAGVVIGVAALAATATGVSSVRSGRAPWRDVARVLAVGFALAAFAATTEPRVWHHRGFRFEWGIGDGGLRDWRVDLRKFPTTIGSVLLVGNVLVYVPMGLLVALGWQRRPLVSFAGALAVPVVVEALQGAVLRGAGSTDDILLNWLGIAIGWILGVAMLSVRSASAATRRRGVRIDGHGAEPE